MKYSTETYILQTKILQDLEQEIKLKLLFMLSYMGPEMLKLEASLEETVEMVNDLKKDSSKIRHHLMSYENELQERLVEVIFRDWMGEGSVYDQNTVH